MLVQLSSYITISLALQQNCRELCSYFLWLTYCKSEVQSSGQQKVIKGTIAEETVAAGPLVERSANEKTVVKRMVNKKLEFD